MKVFALLTMLLISSQTFASTPFTFHCEFSGAGACMIEDATEMPEVQDGLFYGVEKEDQMFYMKGLNQMSVWRGDDMIAFSQNGEILAVLNRDKSGMVGIILGDEGSAFKSIDAAKNLKK